MITSHYKNMNKEFCANPNYAKGYHTTQPDLPAAYVQLDKDAPVCNK